MSRLDTFIVTLEISNVGEASTDPGEDILDNKKETRLENALREMVDAVFGVDYVTYNILSSKPKEP